MSQRRVARRLWRTRLPTAIACLLATACSAGDSPPAEAAAVVEAEWVLALMEAHGVPGLSLAVLRDGRVVWTGGFGARAASARGTVTAETVFEAASLSKPIFAYLVMRLVDQGVLALDSPLVRSPGFRYDGADRRLERVTARQILTHTAGFPPWERDEQLRLDAEPGSAWRYSGEGYVFLQHVVERLTGERLSELGHRLVFEPLGMSRSSFGWSARLGDDVAFPHDSAGRPATPVHYGEREVGRYGAASALYTTAADFGRFLDAVLAASRSSPISELFVPVVVVQESPGLSWGPGWAIQDGEGSDPWVFHWGANPGFRSFVMAHPGSGSGWVALANGALGLELMDELARRITGRDHPLFDFYMLHPTD